MLNINYLAKVREKGRLERDETNRNVVIVSGRLKKFSHSDSPIPGTVLIIIIIEAVLSTPVL